MDTFTAVSYLALLWPVVCLAQQSTSVVATLQLPNTIFSTTPHPTAFDGFVSTSTVNDTIVTAYTLSCEDFAFCQSVTGYGQFFEFTAATDSTTYDLETNGVIVCGVTDNGPTFSGTALCTATAIPPEYYGAPGTSTKVFTDSSSYVIYFPSVDEELASSLGATTTTYIPTSTTIGPAAATSAAATSAAVASTVAMTTAPLTGTSVSTSTSAGISASVTTSASSTSSSTAQAVPIPSSSPTSSAMGSHDLTEQEKIGVGVGIVAFVLVCCAVGVFLKSYRRKRRAANPNPSELYFNTDDKGQAAIT